jgi:TolB-like protein
MASFNLVSGRRRWGLIFLAYLSCQLVACQSASVNVSEPPSGPLRIKSILVLPFFDLSNLPGQHPDTRSPASGRMFITGEVIENATDFLTDHVVSWLQSNTAYVIRIPDHSPDAPAILDASGGDLTLNRKNLTAMGRKLDADAVLVGFVYRFRERVGNGFSAESPASVAFDLHLIRVIDGRTVWSGNFDETQQTLGQNLFQLGTFLTRGGRWITAEDMATDGLDKILSKFPKQ